MKSSFKPVAQKTATPTATNSAARQRNLLRELNSLKREFPIMEQTGRGISFKRRRAIVFNDPLDVEWAHPAPDDFPRIGHLFHQEWYGIRAAAGYLPGDKIGIPFHGAIAAAQIDDILEFIQKKRCEQILLHCHSNNMEEVARSLRGSFGDSLRIYSVWHGNTAQFHVDGERHSVQRLLQLKRLGVVDQVCFVKPGMRELSSEFFPDTLLNVPPHVPRTIRSREPKGAVLIPIPLDWRKNFYTNYLAACAADGVEEVHVVAQDFERLEDFEHGRRVVAHGHLDRAALFALVADADLSLNVTLSECQPMAALESLAFQVPCLTGPLDNGALDLHPLQKLVQLRAIDSLSSVRQAIEHLLRFRREHPDALEGMMNDYRDVLQREAFARYLRLFDA